MHSSRHVYAHSSNYAKNLRTLGLNVHSNPTQNSIRRAYHSRALHVHPNKGGHEDAFKALGSAYARLQVAAEQQAAAEHAAREGARKPPADWRKVSHRARALAREEQAKQEAAWRQAMADLDARLQKSMEQSDERSRARAIDAERCRQLETADSEREQELYAAKMAAILRKLSGIVRQTTRRPPL